MPNRLANQFSPYLLQHANNPVDWYPWGVDALSRAVEEEKPIFLSIGYSACHWCHVMEHESFENEELAAQLNESFICIKVDREERPDLDHIYMSAVQMINQGHGGWPMSVFLTPEGQPFFGGTYWPPTASRGMPGFDQIIAAVRDAWTNRRSQALEQAGKLTEHMSQIGISPPSSGTIRPELLQASAVQIERIFDSVNGGFGQAPKFPHSMDLQVLLRTWRRWRRETHLGMVGMTLDKMSRGGIYDHLGGGFARYSVDERWLVPHFEKMLYDNASLAVVYLENYQATRRSTDARVVRETLDYILEQMTDVDGGFYSTEDADSEGEEGKFYVWTIDEVTEMLGEQAAEKFCYVYDVTQQGNFEEKNILNLPKTVEQCAQLRGWEVEALQAELQESRSKLLQKRNQRVRPGKDDKVLVNWNGLMVDAMARAAAVLREPRYLSAASQAASFIQNKMMRTDGRLLHGWRQGEAKLDAYLDDYTCLINGLVTLYESSMNESWIDKAVGLADIVLEHFRDDQEGALFYTADDHEQLIIRNKDLQDGSTPSGNSMAATALARLGALCGRADYIDAAHKIVSSAIGLIEQSPLSSGQMLIALDLLVEGTCEIVMVDRDDSQVARELLADFHRRFLPHCVVAFRAVDNVDHHSSHLDDVFRGKKVVAEATTVYLCRGSECEEPVHGRDAILALWDRLETS